MSEALRSIEVMRVGPARRALEPDVAAAEEPLEIRLHGEPFAVVMRTPGADRELAAGFLFSERIVRAAGEIATIRHCADPAHPDRRNVIDVTLDGVDPAGRVGERRRVLTSSACGLCGRVTIESLQVEAPQIDADWTLAAGAVAALPARLRGGQVMFGETGGLHAAALVAPDGALEDIAEDVGRHNAVDKIVGRRLLEDRLPIATSILVVSGRTSFEIVQKAFLAGIPIVAAVSAPSSLAIELADEAGITLLGFVRGDTFNVYAHAWRIGEQ